MGENILDMKYKNIKSTNKSNSLFEKLIVLDINIAIIYDDLLTYNSRYTVLKFYQLIFEYKERYDI